MNLIEFGRISANVIVFLIVWHLAEAWIARKYPDSDTVRAMAFVTGG